LKKWPPGQRQSRIATEDERPIFFMFDPKAFDDRLAERGKEDMVVNGAAMRKLLHICYGVLKNQTPFDASLHPGT
jgi:hypothetical protein